MLYTKGIEEELFVGDRHRNVSGFVRELNGRPTEYSTEPCRSSGCILNLERRADYLEVHPEVDARRMPARHLAPEAPIQEILECGNGSDRRLNDLDRDWDVSRPIADRIATMESLEAGLDQQLGSASPTVSTSHTDFCTHSLEASLV